MVLAKGYYCRCALVPLVRVKVRCSSQIVAMFILSVRYATFVSGEDAKEKNRNISNLTFLLYDVPLIRKRDHFNRPSTDSSTRRSVSFAFERDLRSNGDRAARSKAQCSRSSDSPDEPKYSR